MEKLFQMMDNVKELLTNWTSIRDNDEKLMANIWGMYIGEKDLDDMSGRDVLSALSEGKLPSYESISRCRRKLQEQHPNLSSSFMASFPFMSPKMRKFFLQFTSTS